MKIPPVHNVVRSNPYDRRSVKVADKFKSPDLTKLNYDEETDIREELVMIVYDETVELTEDMWRIISELENGR
jgi:hypothetical protein